MKTEIEWHDAFNELPDTDISVLMGLEGDEVALIGYYDSENDCWRAADAMRFEATVTVWADLPRVPSREEVAR